MKRSLMARPALLIVCCALGFAACDENEPAGLTKEEVSAIAKKASESNHQVIVATQEVLDITSGILSDEGISIQESNASPQNCNPSLIREYVMDRTHYDTIIYAGTITVDYGNGSSCQAASPVRKGQIKNTFTYIINLKNDGSFAVDQSIMLENYRRDTTTITGIFRTLAASGMADSLETFGARITYPNGTSIKWNGTLANERINTGSLEEDLKSIRGSIGGTTTDGRPFFAEIVEPILYSYACAESGALIPVKGIVHVTVNGIDAVINYGNGECDRTYTVIADGEINTYTF